MDEKIEGELGLQVLHEGLNSSIDIVAVHGLGANPKWAWVRKVEVKATGENKEVNWLADSDLLPKVVPNARIMAFNYESKWHADAPKQRRSLCAEQLLTALYNKRKEENTETRPLIFIGHSFGGIVIEQALVTANSRSNCRNIATATVGVIFLGTPHRGTAAAKWGELIAFSAKQFGWSSENKILKDLREDSETLEDLVHEFALWLFHMSVPTVCFFEQHETDYRKRFRVRWKELVVNEKSACLDGHRKLGLPIDHLKINKYSGPEDPSFRCVYPAIKEMAQNAEEIVQRRLNPREIIRDNSGVREDYLPCLQSLYLTNPPDDLAAIRRSKGRRVDSTCEWLLVREEYTTWLVREGVQLLWLVGAPGIGKTMISSFLVDELEERAQKSPGMIFAYYFCDNKNESRNTATAIIRGLLLQLLRQDHGLFELIQPDFRLMKDKLWEGFDALWRNFVKTLGRFKTGEVYLLIDALDECEISTRKALLVALTELLNSTQSGRTANVKFLITSRPENDIALRFSAHGYLQIDSAKVNNDLSKFVKVKVDELSQKKQYSEDSKKMVQGALVAKTGGTFLWVSLVLVDLEDCDDYEVEEMLSELPKDLNEIYDRILKNIKKGREEIAEFVLRCTTVARRPLTDEELATAYAVKFKMKSTNSIPSIKNLAGIFKSCEPLIYLDEKNRTVNLVHQSAKDYLLGNYLRDNTDLTRYRVVPDTANLLVFQICWKYLSVKEFDQGKIIISRDAGNVLHNFGSSRWYALQEMHCFLKYAMEEWQEHAIAAHSAFLEGFKWESLALRDAC